MKHFKLTRFYWVGIAVLFFCSSSFANQTSAILSRLIQEAKHNNPQIRAAYSRVLAANNRIPQSGALPDPNINLGYMDM